MRRGDFEGIKNIELQELTGPLWAVLVLEGP